MSRPILDETHDPDRTSWVVAANGHPDFPVQNLPFGVFAHAGERARGGVAIGDRILDLGALSASGLLSGEAALAARMADWPTLNLLFDLGAEIRRTLRRSLSTLLSDEAYRAAIEPMLYAASECRLELPMRIGDYTDFYVGIHHATNVGKLFRPDNPLLPNYRHVPIGYHGRASSVVASGTEFRRPKGQRKSPAADLPVYGPTERLDYELELGVWIGRGNALGEPVPIASAFDAIAGVSLLNDWSARDVQAWEYQPLGPFLAKNFATTVSPWVVTAEALAPFRVEQVKRAAAEPAPLPYLWDDADQAAGALAATLDVHIASLRMRQEGLAPHRLSRTSASNMYWTIAQLVAHHSSGGCNLSVGDLLGTGTISGSERNQFGSLLEITAGGADRIALPTGETRSFIEDGDEIILSGRFDAPGRVSIGFGECRGIVAAADAGLVPASGNREAEAR